MKTISILTAAILSVAPFAIGSTTVTTDPVGYHTININPGTQAVGFPLLRSAVLAAGIQSNTASVVTLTGVVNAGAALTADVPYYLEITSGSTSTYLGERFDVDVASTIANGNSTVTILTSSSNNTISGNLPDLSGYNFVIRPYHTIGSIFGVQGTTPFKGSTNPNTADQILLYDSANSRFETYFLLQTSSIQQWRKLGGGTSVYDNLPIPPGTGVFVVRNGETAINLTIQGDVRTIDFHAQPLKAGYNFISEGFPISRSPAGSGSTSRFFTTANGFTGSTNPNNADQILVWNGTGFKQYFLLSTTISGVPIEQWRLIGGGTTDYSSTDIFSFDKAVLIKKTTADNSYAETKPF